jgi:hypothetical protein
VRELNVISLRDYLRSRLFPKRNPADVIAVSVRQDDVLDWSGAFSAKEFVMNASVRRYRGVDDHVAFRRRNHEGIPETQHHLDRLVDLYDRVPDTRKRHWVVRHPVLLSGCDLNL